MTEFFAANQNMIILVGLISGILGIAAFGSALRRWYRGTPTAVTVTNSAALIPARRPNLIEMNPSEFTVWTSELRETAYTEPDKLHGPALIALEDKITDLTRQLANPEEALAQQHAIIISLEEKLSRFGNDIGGDRIAAAKPALEASDYSIADDIFAEIEAREEIAVQNAARAPFGRGEVAEAQVRWQDAYTHYKRAAALHETTDHLESPARMTWRLAKGDEAVAVNEKVLALVKAEFGEQSHDYATRFNNLGVNMAYQDRFTEARDLLEQALFIYKATPAADHRDIAGNKQNLTAVIAKMA